MRHKRHKNTCLNFKKTKLIIVKRHNLIHHLKSYILFFRLSYIKRKLLLLQYTILNKIYNNNNNNNNNNK